MADPFLTADTIEDLSKYNYPSSQRVNDDMECWIDKNMEFVRMSMMIEKAESAEFYISSEYRRWSSFANFACHCLTIDCRQICW